LAVIFIKRFSNENIERNIFFDFLVIKLLPAQKRLKQKDADIFLEVGNYASA